MNTDGSHDEPGDRRWVPQHVIEVKEMRNQQQLKTIDEVNKMNKKRQKATHPEKTNVKKLPMLQPLKLEKLEEVCGADGITTATGGAAWL